MSPSGTCSSRRAIGSACLFSSARALVEAGFSGIDCLVTDIGMPGMDGFELHEAVKRARRDLPVFMITGRDEIGDRQRASAAAVRGFFRKPFDGPALLAAVGDAFRSLAVGESMIGQAQTERPKSPIAQQKEAERPLVIVVDDDAALCEALNDLILSAGMEPACFGSTQDLLDAKVLDRPGCLILDVRMPGVSGLDLQRHLASTGNPKPIIFLTGHGDIPMSVQAMKAGAVDFLTKPAREQTLIDAVLAAIEKDRTRRATAEIVKRNVGRLNTLTAREREILAEVARCRLNKQIAYDFGISEVTVKLISQTSICCICTSSTW